jgi:hypothetical protein
MAFQQYMTIEWIKEHIKDPIPLSDKRRVHELLDILTHDDHTDPEKCGALNGLGFMSIRYGAFFVIMCGVLPVFKKYLSSTSKPILLATISNIKYIAQAGGCQELIDEEIDEILRLLIINTEIDFFIRNAAATSYGWTISNPPGEVKSYVIG